MIGTNQYLRPILFSRIGRFNRLSQSLDVLWMLKVGFNRAGCGLPLFFHQRTEELIIGGRRCRASVMRVKWKEQNLLATGFNHLTDLGLGRRVAIAHAKIDHDRVTVGVVHRLFDLCGLILCDRHQGAFTGLVVPNRRVVLTAGKGAFG